MSADADDAGVSYVRTTVSLREDVYQRLKRSGGSLSDTLNDILTKEFQRDHRLFGKLKTTGRTDIRDHIDRV